jgi:hypothetical protein
MIIVSLSHKSRVGKDTFAGFLQTALRVKGVRTQKASFAAKLKQVCFIMYGWAGLREAAYYETDEGAAARQVKLPLLDMTPVDIWGQVGNKIREVFPNTWLNSTLMTEYPNVQVLIVTDARFPNEGDKVVELGGIPIRITNSRAPVLGTVADVAMDGWDKWVRHVENEEGLRELNAEAEKLAAEIVSIIKGSSNG